LAAIPGYSEAGPLYSEAGRGTLGRLHTAYGQAVSVVVGGVVGQIRTGTLGTGDAIYEWGGALECAVHVCKKVSRGACIRLRCD
jgi:hypothetical protein